MIHWKLTVPFIKRLTFVPRKFVARFSNMFFVFMFRGLRFLEKTVWVGSLDIMEAPKMHPGLLLAKKKTAVPNNDRRQFLRFHVTFWDGSMKWQVYYTATKWDDSSKFFAIFNPPQTAKIHRYQVIQSVTLLSPWEGYSPVATGRRQLRDLGPQTRNPQS